MKAIILSPGPSLAAYIPRAADLIIAVNRAAIAHACDIWACGDTPAIEGRRPDEGAEAVLSACKSRGQAVPKLLAYSVTIDTLRDHRFGWPSEIVSWTPMADAFLHPSIANWPFTTFTSAVVYALWQGATEVEVFGADWEGTADYDGVQAGMNRSDDRWREERGIFGAIQTIFAERGIKIERKQPEPVAT